MNTKTIKYLLTITAVLTGFFTFKVHAAGDLPTLFSNTGGITNTRHNMTQSTIAGGGGSMNGSRNNYGEVCVYCHTPHGSNTTIDLPLWNRSNNNQTYTTYDTLGSSSITSDIQQPGINSLACLSCHDGTLGVDSVINMPGSGGYSVNQQTGQNNGFLDTWASEFGGNPNAHIGLDGVNEAAGCLACHSTNAPAAIGQFATDFRLFAIGTDLTNDHPVGISLPPNGAGTDFNSPTGTRVSIQWFDNDGDARPDTDEIRFYDTGSGPRVECGSCHDPHGVSPGGSGGLINTSFLRISNENSRVCLTCHVK
jgi:hypothetical protein